MLAALARARAARCAGAEARRALEGLAGQIDAIGQLQVLLERSGSAGLALYIEEMAPLWNRVGRDRDIAVRVHVGSAPPVPYHVSLPLAHIAHEAVSNCFDHAFPEGGGLIRVNLGRTVENGLCLSIVDDGIGFDMPERRVRGCRAIRDLAAIAGGKAEWRRRPLKGTVLSVIVPPAAGPAEEGAAIE